MIDILILVINITKRTDKRDLIIKDFKPYKKINLRFIEAIERDNGAVGCFLSHKKCIQIAKNLNFPYIIVIEDDCMPTTNFENRLLEIIEYLQSRDDWDVFMGAANSTREQNIEKKITYKSLNIYKINMSKTTHFMIYNHTSYDFFLNYDENENPIDMCWHGKLRVYTTVPFLAFQRPNFSDIAKRETTNVRILQITEKRFAKFTGEGA